MDPSAYSLKPIILPAEEPLTRAEAQAHIGVPVAVTAHNGWIDSHIIAARQRAELLTGRQLVTATWELNLDAFPTGSRAILLPRMPLQSVTSVTYYDTAGVLQTLATSVYKVLTYREPAEIALKYGQVWPVAQYEPESVIVRYVSGYGAAAAVPDLVKAALYIMLDDWFNNRHGEEETPQAAVNLLRQFEFGDEYTDYTGRGRKAD